MYFLLNVCCVGFEPRRKWFTTSKRQTAVCRSPDILTKGDLRQCSAGAAKRNPLPATTNFLKIPQMRYFCLENSVSRRSIVCNYVDYSHLSAKADRFYKTVHRGFFYYHPRTLFPPYCIPPQKHLEYIQQDTDST